MKFKLIFAMFNGIIVISFVFVFLMPLFVLGLDYTADFWRQNWYLIALFVVILFLLDFYFFLNWKMFALLEQEDWTGLSVHLEARIFQKKRINDQTVRLLCNAWVVQGKPLEILRLEAFFRTSKAKLIRRYGLILGVPHLLQNDSSDIINFYRPLAESKNIFDAEWIKFNLAFGLLGARQAEEAVQLLDILAGQKKERIVQLLSLYLLDSQDIQDAESQSSRTESALEFRTHFTAESLSQHIERFRENLQVIILSKFIGEASAWMFTSKSATLAGETT